MDEKQEIQSLRRELEQANYEYYLLDNPSMSDYDFDHKLRRLEELEAAHPELVTPRFSHSAGGGQGGRRLPGGAPPDTAGEPSGRVLRGGAGGVRSADAGGPAGGR